MPHALNATETIEGNGSVTEPTDHGGRWPAGKVADSMPTRDQIRAHTLSNAAKLHSDQSMLLADRDVAFVVMRDGEIRKVLESWNAAVDWAEREFADAHYSVHEISRTPPFVPIAAARF